MHFHADSLQQRDQHHRIHWVSRSSTDAKGIAASLGLQITANGELEVVVSLLKSKISPKSQLRN
jgi:hypothetical protein